MTIHITKDYEVKCTLSVKEVCKIFSCRKTFDEFIEAMTALKKSAENIAALQEIERWVENG